MKAYQAQGRTIVYLDESGFASDMPRTHGYATKGQRCYGLQDWNAKGRINVTEALLVGELSTVGLADSNVDADIFNLWLEQDLIPKLPAHSVIVMDNATFHKRADTKHMIKNVGHTLAYLTPYSPDLNPIEQKWAQAKAIRRKTGKSTD
ncbi:MAG: transposase [Paracoccaceae bacterium]|nr:transposase [Paracoccaceae bacterium]